MRFLGTIKTTCSYCCDERLMRVHCNPESLDAAPGTLENTVRKAFKLMEQKLLEDSWAEAEGKWCCSLCVDRIAKHVEDQALESLGFNPKQK